MAHQMPLKEGYSVPDLGDHQNSTEADRRADQTVTAVRSNPHNYHGDYPASDQSRPEGGRLWKVGQATPNSFLSAPFPTIMMDGDNNGMPAEVHEIDVDSYGDCYDPTSPMRVRVADNYHLDSDHDGHLN